MISVSEPDYSKSIQPFLQRRVALSGMVGGIMFLAFLIFRFIVMLFSDHTLEDCWSDPSMVYHALASVSLFSMWVLCYWGTHSQLFIRSVEIVGITATVIATSAMGTYIHLTGRPDMIVILALTYGLALRSVYVPSSAFRTFIICAISGLPVVANTYIMYLKIDVSSWPHASDHLRMISNEEIARMVMINATAYWVCTIVLCTAASKVIYGLRHEAHKARKLGQYTLVEKLGQGSMGEVYLAHHSMLRRPTAVKLLHPDKTGETNLVRFEREVQLTAGLSHPNTVTIFDFGRTPDGIFYYAMEHLDGVTVEQIIISDGAQPVGRVIHILEQVAAALNEAHGVGLIHRDIKPANIIICEQGGLVDVAKVVDFGLVKDLQAEEDVKLTSPEVVTGTPLYMAPESIHDPSSVDGRADIYALGAIGYLLLTGSDVFVGNTIVEVCGHHLHSIPEPPSQRLKSNVPEDFERLLLSCLEKDPAYRPQSAAALQEALLACHIGEKWDQKQARAWWRKHKASLQERRLERGDSLVSGTVLDIDFNNRKGA